MTKKKEIFSPTARIIYSLSQGNFNPFPKYLSTNNMSKRGGEIAALKAAEEEASNIVNAAREGV